MGLATSAIVALGVTQAGMQIASGISKSKEIERQAEYNARVYEQQAGMIESQKGLEAYQYNRAIARARGTGIARTAKSGLLFSGSPLAVMVDTETQMQLDKSIGQYNLEVQKRYALSGAAEYRRQGKIGAKTALWAGYTNAFTTLLQTGAFASMSMSAPAQKYAYVSGKGRVPIAPKDYYLTRAARL